MATDRPHTQSARSTAPGSSGRRAHPVTHPPPSPGLPPAPARAVGASAQGMLPSLAGRSNPLMRPQRLIAPPSTSRGFWAPSSPPPCPRPLDLAAWHGMACTCLTAAAVACGTSWAAIVELRAATAAAAAAAAAAASLGLLVLPVDAAAASSKPSGCDASRAETASACLQPGNACHGLEATPTGQA